ncbi:hypothetical protein LOTGIDRAFT_175013 [Lottia gigantea]|uniref:Endonuclease/exonuclease/phosphatase domain-containing protein n=1 Tax=Lottia gigantea TaxID=225164 RepID=V4AGF3_LOTGI|nr:hypothetical protein LOTGIDRAFT_175013 [Lottia gigantea]ESO95957.1 hypothetical protein LOTGIDRAFT_175013 [Lottia gigantea]
MLAVRGELGEDSILSCVPKNGDVYEVSLIDIESARVIVDKELKIDNQPIFVRHLSSKMILILMQVVQVVLETFWGDSFINQYQHLWDGDIYGSCDSVSHRRGCAILVSKHFSKSVSLVFSSNDGRFLMCSFERDAVDFNIVSCYAPNAEDDRPKFLERLESDTPSEKCMICGDFNDVMNPFCDRAKGMASFGVGSSCLSDFVDHCKLIDCWRFFNPFSASLQDSRLYSAI